MKEGQYPAGSLVIKRNQPYGRLAKILLEKQNYPDPTLRTYDDSAWTMGLMAHVKIVPIADLAVLDVPTEPVERFEPKGKVTSGSAAMAYAVLDNGSVNLATLRFRLKDLPIQVAEQSFQQANISIPAGSYLFAADALPKLQPAVEALGLTAIPLMAKPTVAMHEADVPRLAVYSTWGSTQDVGWVRYAFDYFQAPYDLIFKEQAKAGDLRSKYDVIVIPSQARNAKGLVFDLAPKRKPLPYTKTAEFKYLGDYGSSEDYIGRHGTRRRRGVPQICGARRRADYAGRSQCFSGRVWHYPGY